MTCTVVECGRPLKSKRSGLCNAHYRRRLRHGDPLAGGPSRSPVRRDLPCAVSWCDSPRESSLYCISHYLRNKRHGDPEGGRRANMESLEEVFRWYMPGSPPAEGVVWPWNGPMRNDGYGTIQCNGTVMLAHRYAYELFVGPIPDGLVVRHKNDTPHDVNPNNLEVGRVIDNVHDIYLRGRNRHASPSGVANAMHRVNEDDVRRIRHLRNIEKAKLSDIADLFDISPSNVCAIARRRSWRHI